MTDGTTVNRGRRKFLKMGAGLGGVAIVSSIVSDYATRIPFGGYVQDLNPSLAYQNELNREVDTYGDVGDRVAYAVNHLAQKRGYNAVPADTVGQVAEFLKGLDTDTKSVSGGEIRTPAAAVLADELLDSTSAEYAKKYPRLAYIHAHVNALFAIQPMQFIVDNDPRLIALANARFTKGRVNPDLDYGVSSNVNLSNGTTMAMRIVNKPDFVRSGFIYWASKLGSKLNSMDPQLLAATVNQTMAGDVIDQLGTIQNYNQTHNKELIWSSSPGYFWGTFPTDYAYSSGSYRSISLFGLNKSNQIWHEMPDNIKYNWLDGKMTRPFAGQSNVADDLDNWLSENYHIPNAFKGAPEFESAFYKTLYASQGLPAYNFEVLTPNFEMGGKTYPLSSYFTVGGDDESGIDTGDLAEFSPKSKYMIDIQKTVDNVQKYGWAGPVDYLRAYTPHRWHTGNLFDLLWKKS